MVDAEEPAEGFAVRVQRRGGDAFVAVSGELDIWSGPQLTGSLSVLVEEVQGSITLDLHEVRSIDPSGVNVIVGAIRQAQAAGIGFTVVGATASMRRLLDATGVVNISAAEAMLASEPGLPAIGHRPLLRAADVAQLFEVSTRTVAQWARQGRIPYVTTPGGQRRYAPEEVFRLLRERSERL